MKLKMAPNSVFAILLRSRWWVSLAVGAAAAALALAVAPAGWQVPAAAGALPFFVIAGIAAWRQLQAPSPKTVARAVDSARAMAWPQWLAAVEQAYRRDGWEVERLSGGGADLALSRGARGIVVACRRWKVARLGVEPLRELKAIGAARDADECVCIALGELTDQALKYAAAERIRVVQGEALARLLG